MIKPPYTKWINDIKTKLGFNRTMTASGEDVVDAVNKQSAEIGVLANLKTYDKATIVDAINAAIIPQSTSYTIYTLAVRTLYTQCRFYIPFKNIGSRTITVNRLGITNYFGFSQSYPGNVSVSVDSNQIMFIYENNTSPTYFQNDYVLDIRIQFTIS